MGIFPSAIRTHRFRHRFFAPLLAAAIPFAPFLAAQAAPVAFKTIYRFPGSPNGDTPRAGLAMDANGVLYGVTAFGGTATTTCSSGCGTVFSLTPPVKGSIWTEQILYNFQGNNDGGNPLGTLIVGPDGTLYGTTEIGGTTGVGTVFSLTPPTTPGGMWTNNVLYSFADNTGGNTDGSNPMAGLAMDANGVLYGTTASGGVPNATCFGGTYCGTVFTLTPPAVSGDPWTETVIYRFAGGADGANPISNLIVGRNGVLYGTTAYGGVAAAPGNGTVFKLTPPKIPGGMWTKTILHNFIGTDGANPIAGVTLDPTTGALYGTTVNGGTANDGTVFKLTPPAWTPTIFSFTGANGINPYAGLAVSKGVAYGATALGGTSNNGTLFSVTKAGITTLYNFTGGKDERNPYSSPIMGKNRALYGTTDPRQVFTTPNVSGSDGSVYSYCTKNPPYCGN